MSPILTSPLALLALLGVPALVAIYFFQRRFRTLEVSSILLWDAIRQPSMGGRRRERVRFPVSFWLEVLAVVLLALAAAGPLIAMRSRSRPLVIVCDDSLSMRGTARERAKAFIETELRRRSYSPVRILFAGPSPQLAGPGQLAEWSCSAPSADLDAAIAMASQIASPNGLILVVSDRGPSGPPGAGRIRWHAFGSPAPNLGFVAATRAGRERDRVLLEVANYGTRAQSTTLRVNAGERSVHEARIDVRPRARQRVQLTLPPGTPAVQATLGADGAAFDNEVVLLPDVRRPLRVDVQLGEELRPIVESGLTATNRVTITSQDPDLVVGVEQVSGLPPAAPEAGRRPALHLQILRGPNATAFIGPYVVDRTHPLTAGLALDGVVWGAPRGPAEGDPVIVVGTQPLLTAQGDSVQLRFDPAVSNLHRTPAWPALLWNLVEWRSASLPGPRAANVTLGQNVSIRLPAAVEATVVAPDGSRRTVDAQSGTVVVAANAPGVWRVDDHAFAANAIVPGESDLSPAASGSWGQWDEEAMTSAGYESAAWLLLLAALATLALHQRVTWGAVPS
jgi:hypothetical protein